MEDLQMEKEYGLVLEGGGARGSYQIGVWKALKELDIKIKGIVGTSVGALNGALILQGELESAYNLWSNIKYSQIIKTEDEIIDKLIKIDLKELRVKDIIKKLKEMVVNKGLDITPLKELVSEIIDEECIRSSGIDFGLVTVCLTDKKPLEIFIDDIPKGQLIDFLLASSYLPLFKNDLLHGKRYIDGGFYNKCPINMLVDKGYENIIVVRIHGLGIDRKVNEENLNIIEIVSPEVVNGLLEFDGMKSRMNINLGYYDTLRIFKDLKGKKYYINVREKEEFFINKILGLPIKIKQQIIDYTKIENDPINRTLLEAAIPKIAKNLDMPNGWDYSDFIILILEYYALKLEINRFKEYTYTEFLTIIKFSIKNNHPGNNLLDEIVEGIINYL